MKLRIIFSCLLFAIANFGIAQKVIPELWGQRIHDEVKILKTSTIDKLEKDLKVFEDSTSNQIAILIISSLEGELLEDYSLKVAEKWALGTRSKDNGVLFLVAVDDHAMRIEVGQGLQGKLTDAICSRIIRNELAPAFRRSDYDGGVLKAIELITQTIKGEYIASAEEEDKTGWIIFAVVFGLVCIGLLVYSFVQEGNSSSNSNDSSSPNSNNDSVFSKSSSSSSSSSERSFDGGGGSFDGGGSSGKW